MTPCTSHSKPQLHYCRSCILNHHMSYCSWTCHVAACGQPRSPSRGSMAILSILVLSCCIPRTRTG